MEPSSIEPFTGLLLTLNSISLPVAIALLVMIVLLISSALISGSEVAFFSIDAKDREILNAEKDPKSLRVLDQLVKPKKLLATILIANNFIKELIKSDVDFKKQPIALLGFAFKENCPDIRNSKVIDLYRKLNEFSDNVVVYDPLVDAAEVYEHYGLTLINTLPSHLDVAVVAVRHSQFYRELEDLEIGYLYEVKK